MTRKLRRGAAGAVVGPGDPHCASVCRWRAHRRADSVPAVAGDVREAAGAIRPYLPRLLGTAASDVDARLAVLLTTQDTDDALSDVLAAHPATATWTATYLETGLPPEFTERDRGYSPLPGRGERIAARRYACPEGDFVWYERSVIEEPPVCPTHGLTVVAP